MTHYYDLVMAKTIRKYGKFPNEQMPKELWAPAPGLSKKKEWADIKAHFYGTQTAVITENGLIDFDPQEVMKIAHGESLTYDEYLDIAWKSRGESRRGFEKVYYDAVWAGYKGRVEKVTPKGMVCFQKIFISGDYGDGDGFFDKENHVWMQTDGFPELKPGMCVSFVADVYRYLKTSNGKVLDFGLRNPECVKVIDEYELPTDDDLLKQEIDNIICENMCMFREHCNGFCIANDEWRNDMRMKLFTAAKLGKLPEEELDKALKS